MSKKLLSLMLTFMLVLTCVSGLTVFAADVVWEGEGTEESPYLIKTAEDLNAISKDGNYRYDDKFFAMTNDIDMSSIENFMPIGSGWSSDFRATFDGRGFEVKNLTINADAVGRNYNLGLFGYLSASTVKNLTVRGTLTGNNEVAGIVGNANVSVNIINCKNYVTVNGNNNIGGIVGYSKESIVIDQCENYGAINSTGENIGGLVGSTNATITTITNSKNFGTITCNGNAGGLVGKDNSQLVIEDSVNEGNIVCENANNVAGIVTNLKENSSLTNCVNKGTLSKIRQNGAGIVGSSSGTVTNCDNYGVVDGYDWGIAGIVNGYSDGVIVGCDNYGSVTGGGNTGGIVGVMNNGNKGLVLENCNNYGSVTGGWEHVGAIVGDATSAHPDVIKNCSSTGNFQGHKWSGGIVGRAGRITIENCNVSGTIHCVGGEYFGGIVGQIWGGEDYPSVVKNCTNSATMNPENNSKWTGGIAGYMSDYVTVEDCTHSGTLVSKNESAGGIVGYAEKNTTIQNNANIGAVTGRAWVGGILGQLCSAVTFKNNTNTANVTATGGKAGGIIGRNNYSNGVVEHCLNTGVVEGGGADKAGGVFGGVNGNVAISDCYVKFDNANAAGIAGALENDARVTLVNNYVEGTLIRPIHGWKGGSATDVSTNNIYAGTYTDESYIVGFTKATDEQLASGEAAWSLNKNHADAALIDVEGTITPSVTAAPKYVWSNNTAPIWADADNNPVYKYTVNYTDGSDVIYYMPDVAESMKVYVAQYSNEGQLLDVVKSATHTFADELSIETGIAQKTGSTSVMFWTDMTPLCVKIAK